MQMKKMLTYVESSGTGTADFAVFLLRMFPCETAQTGGGSTKAQE